VEITGCGQETRMPDQPLHPGAGPRRFQPTDWQWNSGAEREILNLNLGMGKGSERQLERFYAAALNCPLELVSDKTLQIIRRHRGIMRREVHAA
jgi:hypothetical protein